MKRLLLISLLAMVGARAEWTPIGPDGGNVLALAADYANPSTMYCVPYEYPAYPRLFRSLDQGGTWTAVGLLPQSSVSGLAVDRHLSQTLYSLSQSTMVLRSTDGGVRWSSTTLPGYGMALKVDPFQTGRLMVSGYVNGTCTQAAVFVSTDYGQSWATHVLSPDTNYSYSLAFDPVNAGVAYAGCYYGRVYRTSDGGNTWLLRNGGLPLTSALTSLSVDLADPNVVLAGAGDGVYRTTDAGITWSQITSILRTYALECSPCTGGLAYLIGYDTATRVFVSTDAGASWSPQPANANLGKATSLVADPVHADGIFTNGGVGVLHSADRGVSWELRNSGLRLAKIATITVSPWDRRRVYVEATDNGVFRSENCGSDWTRCEDFLSCGSICGIGVAPGIDHDVLWALEGLG